MTGANIGTLAFYAAIYFLPTIAGWLLAKFTGAEPPLRRLFLLNLLTGWTGIGWFVCWAYLIVKLLSASAARGAASGGTSAPPAPTYQFPTYEPPQRQPCGSCGGSVRTTCW